MTSKPEGSIPELTLLDWKRAVFGLYQETRESTNSHQAWHRWRAARHTLFATHPQSPLPPDERRRGLPVYFPYDAGLRVLGSVAPAEGRRYDIPMSGGETMSFRRFGTVSFQLAGLTLELELYWLEGYGGGLFLPFRDSTSGTQTYGAGRYLYDTVKGADLGMEGGKLVLDFNFAYNPSCAYDARWICPLAPPPNRLNVAIRAGEKLS
jgi:uncharacterized protein